MGLFRKDRTKYKEAYSRKHYVCVMRYKMNCLTNIGFLISMSIFLRPKLPKRDKLFLFSFYYYFFRIQMPFYKPDTSTQNRQILRTTQNKNME